MRESVSAVPWALGLRSRNQHLRKGACVASEEARGYARNKSCCHSTGVPRGLTEVQAAQAVCVCARDRFLRVHPETIIELDGSVWWPDEDQPDGGDIAASSPPSPSPSTDSAAREAERKTQHLEKLRVELARAEAFEREAVQQIEALREDISEEADEARRAYRNATVEADAFARCEKQAEADVTDVLAALERARAFLATTQARKPQVMTRARDAQHVFEEAQVRVTRELSILRKKLKLHERSARCEGLRKRIARIEVLL